MTAFKFDEISNAIDLINSINQTPLEQLAIVDRDGNTHSPTTEEIDQWRFIGLSNFTWVRDILLNNHLTNK